MITSAPVDTDEPLEHLVPVGRRYPRAVVEVGDVTGVSVHDVDLLTAAGESQTVEAAVSWRPSSRSTSLDVPASWLLPALDAGDAALERAGGQRERGAACLHTDLDRADVGRDPRVAVASASAELTGMDRDDAELLQSGGPAFRAFAIDGVASAVAFTTATTVLGVHLHVVRQHRRRGLARALVRHVGAVARATRAAPMRSSRRRPRPSRSTSGSGSPSRPAPPTSGTTCRSRKRSSTPRGRSSRRGRPCPR